MNKDIKYIIKRILIGALTGIILFAVKSCNVKAITTDNNVYINNTLMTSTVKKYSAGAENINVSIRPVSTASVNYDTPQYGYIAVCSAFGSYENRYINTVSSNQVGELAVINSTVGCTIPTTSAYRSTARVVYITFKIPFSYYDCGAGAGVCLWKGNVNLSWYQPASNEFSLISYGFNTEPYNFNDTTNPEVLQNDTIINQNDTQINQNNTIINQNTQINDSINDTNDTIKDDSTPSNNDFNSAISNVNNALPSNGTISSLVTMPITFLQKIIDALNGTCSPVVIGEIFDYNMVMPCINPSDYVGVIWNIIDVICSGFFAFYFGKRLVVIFHKVTSMKEGGLEEAYD